MRVYQGINALAGSMAQETKTNSLPRAGRSLASPRRSEGIYALVASTSPHIHASSTTNAIAASTPLSDTRTNRTRRGFP